MGGQRKTFLASEHLALFAALLALILLPGIGMVLQVLPDSAYDEVDLLGLYVILGLMALLFVGPYFFLAAYRASWRATQTRLDRSADEVASTVDRFTLYLRPFVTSGRLKVPNSWPHIGQRVLLGDPWDLELALATVLEDHAPMVAIGSVKRALGAAKIVVSNDVWRGEMQRLADAAFLLVCLPLDRASTLWEVEEVARQNHLREKAVFMMPPSFLFYDALLFPFRRSISSRWRKARAQLRRAGIQLPHYRRGGGIFVLDANKRSSKVAPLRRFRRNYLAEMLTACGKDGATYQDRAAWFSERFGKWRFVRPILLSPSLYGYFNPNTFRTTVITLLFFSCAFEIRSIPSEHMKPALEVGDRVLVSKFAYGYDRYSIAFGLGGWLGKDNSPNPNERWIPSTPRRGDVVIFQHPHSDRVMINRLIGLPGDSVQVKGGKLYLNGNEVPREKVRTTTYSPDDNSRLTTATEYRQTIPTGEGDKTMSFLIHEFSDSDSLDETPIFKVPSGHVFMMGDNRDNAEDSRAPSGHRSMAAQFPEYWPYRQSSLSQDTRDDAIGFVPMDYLIGRAETVLFTLHGCRQMPGTTCPSARVWRWPLL